MQRLRHWREAPVGRVQARRPSLISARTLPVSGSNLRLGSGMRARSCRNAPTIPTSALRTEGNRRSVFLVEGNTLVERLVEVGDAIEGWVEIRRGLTNGTPVVNPAEPRLADGLPAQVTQP